MKIDFKVINRVPRLILSYVAYSTNGQLAWKVFLFPTSLKNVIDFLKFVFLGEFKVSKDELGILLSHDHVYKKDDIILAVGVGSGISLIHNCSKSRSAKSYIGIEGSHDKINLAIENAILNNVDSFKYELIEGFVGKPDNVYGRTEQKFSKTYNVNDFKFDVLELDCEGSEIEILESLIVKPRVIIVELHPMHRKIDINGLLRKMKTKGYALNKIYTVNGKEVPIENIQQYFSSSNIKMLVDFNIEWGDGLLVVTFVKNDF